MKTMFTFTISILLGGALCLALLQAGIIVPTDGGRLLPAFHAPALPAAKSGPAHAPLPADKHRPETTAKVKVKTPTATPAAAAAGPPPAKTALNKTAPDATGKSAGGSDQAAAERIIAFLDDITPPGQNGPSLESRLTAFMRNTLKLDTATADRLLRMCCWKHFVSLQGVDVPDRQAAFVMEKHLKAAGFAAQGLTLFSIDLEAAEARMKELAKPAATGRQSGSLPLSEETL
ncbi:MAG: hypothetical protein JRJ56_08750 [Deltaproteobacteria bacterium]|nr:hypothetical protein [Deltaproteobacteria bacterium]